LFAAGRAAAVAVLAPWVSAEKTLASPELFGPLAGSDRAGTCAP
jgi:hypothetical protein